MHTRTHAVGISSLGLIVACAGWVSAQDYPTRPIRMVTSEPGGGSDFAARLIAQGLTGRLGKQVIVDNRGGAGISAATIVAKTQPDGYTVLVYGSTLWIQPLMRDKNPWDPVKDFAPIALAVRAPNILVVHPSVAAGSVQELIALARANPGKLNYGSGNAGSSTRLAAELFKSMVGLNIVSVAYRGNGPALTAVIGGEVQMSFPTAGSVMAHIKSGRVKGLAVSSAQPSALAPGMPTVAASGVPGFDSETMTGISAPAGTPRAIVRRLNQDLVRVLNEPEVKEKFFQHGVEVVASSPEEFAAKIKSEMARMGKVIRDAGIREE